MNLSIQLAQNKDGSSKLEVFLDSRRIMRHDEGPGSSGTSFDTSDEEVKQAEDSILKRSPCCGSPVASDMDGRWNCTKCGDACEPWVIEAEETAKEPVRPPCQSCGSLARRHKKGCTMSWEGRNGHVGPSAYECDACSHRFDGVRGEPHPCPNCGSEETFATRD